MRLKDYLKEKKTIIKDSKLRGVKKDQIKIYRTEQDRAGAILENTENLLAYHKGHLNRPVDGFFWKYFCITKTSFNWSAVRRSCGYDNY